MKRRRVQRVIVLLSLTNNFIEISHFKSCFMIKILSLVFKQCLAGQLWLLLLKLKLLPFCRLQVLHRDFFV